jgi:hypothetical protein
MDFLQEPIKPWERPSLQVLGLSGSKRWLQPEQFHLLLRGTPNLVELSVSRCEALDDQAIAMGLAMVPKLKRLHVRRKVFAASAPLTAEAIATHLYHLEYLDMDTPMFGLVQDWETAIFDVCSAIVGSDKDYIHSHTHAYWLFTFKFVF